MDKCCNERCCRPCRPACKGGKMVLLGLVVLANEIYFKYNWWYVFAGILILKGIAVIAMKGCMCNKAKEEDASCCVEEKKDEKHKKKAN